MTRRSGISMKNKGLEIATLRKIIETVCLDCGRKNKTKEKSVMGIWIDDCDMCGAKQVGCADAAHDFGIYSTDKQLKIDKANDAI